MKASLVMQVAAVLLLLLAGVSAVEHQQQPDAIPVLAWSSSPSAFSASRSLSHAVDADTSEQLFQALLSGSEGPVIANQRPVSAQSSAPGVVLAVVLQELGSAQLLRACSTRAPKDTLLCSAVAQTQEAASGLALPYVRPGRPVSTQFRAVAAQSQHRVRLDSGLAADNCRKAQQALVTATAQSAADSTVFLELQLSSPEQLSGSCLQELSEAAKAAAGARHSLVLLVADASPTQAAAAHQRAVGSMMLMSEGLGFGVLAGTNGTNSTAGGVQMITPNILLGLMIGGFLLFMLLSAVCCISAVETPTQFSSNRLAIGKEY